MATSPFLLMWQIVSKLIPQYPKVSSQTVSICVEDIPPVAVDEVLNAAKGVEDNTAHSIDRIPNKVVKRTTKTAHSIFTHCLKQDILPKE